VGTIAAASSIKRDSCSPVVSSAFVDFLVSLDRLGLGADFFFEADLFEVVFVEFLGVDDFFVLFLPVGFFFEELFE